MSLLESVSNHLRFSETTLTGLESFDSFLYSAEFVTFEALAHLPVRGPPAQLHLQGLSGPLDLGRPGADESLGTQSMARNSSKMAPRIRCVQ